MAAQATDYDAIILGGGLAGLCLAIQIMRVRPQTRIAVIEKAHHPVLEAAHKVGESTSEVACHYFANVIGMKEHIDKEQLHKMALRFFMPAGDNRDITRRVEIGARAFPPIDTYQLDRGRFENALGEEVRRLGATFLDGSKIGDVQLGGDAHTVTYDRDGATHTLTGRWIVDASGRAALLKRRLGLAKPADHPVNAAWLRIGEPVNVDDWSDDPEWQARVPGRNRYLSTNHLMGRGYWVWLIPLSSGSHSIGIVADPELHPFDEINTFERTMDWLHRHEPQLAEILEAKRHLRQDFRVLKHFAHGCQQVYSADRWCITGEAGCFNDPFYSPGSDNIALSNSFVCALITRDLEGEDISELAAFFNEAFISAFEFTLSIWLHNYPMFGNAQVFTAKHVFDAVTYWGFIGLLFYNDKFTDAEFMSEALEDVITMGQLQDRMQAFFRQWAALEDRLLQNIFVEGRGGSGMQFLSRLLRELQLKRNDDEVRAALKSNLRLLEAVATAMFRRAAPLIGNVPDSQPINPYAISLSPERWQEDGLFEPEHGSTDDPDVAAQLQSIWLERLASV